MVQNCLFEMKGNKTGGITGRFIVVPSTQWEIHSWHQSVPFSFLAPDVASPVVLSVLVTAQ